MTTTTQERRLKMISALKRLIVPEIKKLGYTGTYPHFRKIVRNKMCFVSFQFVRFAPGNFVIEFRHSTKEDMDELYKDIPFEKLNYAYALPRLRIGPSEHKNDDFWFDCSEFTRPEQYDDLAHYANTFLWVGEEFCQTGINPYFKYR